MKKAKQEDVSAADNLSNDALPNKKHSIFMLSVLFLILSKCFLFEDSTTIDERTNGRKLFSDAKARKLFSSNKKNLAQTGQSLDNF